MTIIKHQHNTQPFLYVFLFLNNNDNETRCLYQHTIILVLGNTSSQEAEEGNEQGQGVGGPPAGSSFTTSSNLQPLQRSSNQRAI